LGLERPSEPRYVCTYLHTSYLAFPTYSYMQTARQPDFRPRPSIHLDTPPTWKSTPAAPIPDVPSCGYQAAGALQIHGSTIMITPRDPCHPAFAHPALCFCGAAPCPNSSAYLPALLVRASTSGDLEGRDSSRLLGCTARAWAHSEGLGAVGGASRFAGASPFPLNRLLSARESRQLPLPSAPGCTFLGKLNISCMAPGPLHRSKAPIRRVVCS
jgi:hypothetical protein